MSTLCSSAWDGKVKDRSSPSDFAAALQCDAPGTNPARRIPSVWLQHAQVQDGISMGCCTAPWGTAAWMNRGSTGRDCSCHCMAKPCWVAAGTCFQPWYKSLQELPFWSCLNQQVHVSWDCYLIKASTTLTLTLTLSKHAHFLFQQTLWSTHRNNIESRAEKCQPFS